MSQSKTGWLNERETRRQQGDRHGILRVRRVEGEVRQAPHGPRRGIHEPVRPSAARPPDVRQGGRRAQGVARGHRGRPACRRGRDRRRAVRQGKPCGCQEVVDLVRDLRPLQDVREHQGDRRQGEPDALERLLQLVRTERERGERGHRGRGHYEVAFEAVRQGVRRGAGRVSQGCRRLESGDDPRPQHLRAGERPAE